MSLKRAFSVLFACGVASAHAGVFGTMEAMSGPPKGERKYDAMTLKPVDVKSCIVDAYSIDVADALFEAMRPQVEQERDELRKLGEAARGKPTGASAAAETQLRMKAQAFNAKVASLNARVAYAQDARDRFSRVCKGRKYYVEDLDSVRGELPVEIRDIVPKR